MIRPHHRRLRGPDVPAEIPYSVSSQMFNISINVLKGCVPSSLYCLSACKCGCWQNIYFIGIVNKPRWSTTSILHSQTPQFLIFPHHTSAYKCEWIWLYSQFRNIHLDSKILFVSLKGLISLWNLVQVQVCIVTLCVCFCVRERELFSVKLYSCCNAFGTLGDCSHIRGVIVS